MEARTPPQDLDAEAAVLGSVMLDPEAFGLIEDLVAPKDFYKPSHGVIFEACSLLFGRGDPIDSVMLAEELRRMGKLEMVGSLPYLAGLMDSVPVSAYAESYARIVREKRILRDLIAASGSTMQAAFDQALPLDEILDEAEQGVYALANVQTGENFTAQPQLAANLSEHLKNLASGISDTLSTGFSDLDRMLSGGLAPGSLNIIAARPSMGKTAFALAIAHNAAARKQGGAFFSLEMREIQLELRLLSMVGHIDMQRLHTGGLGERDWQRAADTLGKLSEIQLVVDDTPELTIAEFRSRSRRLAARQPVNWIIVDYLQLMRATGGNREQEISAISRGLKAVARELDIPVIALAQLSRAVEARPNKRPMLSDLRESGSIEQDADLVMFIYRDEYYDRHSEKQGIAEIILGKQRNGPVGTVELTYLSQHTRFSDLPGPEQQQAAFRFEEGQK